MTRSINALAEPWRHFGRTVAFYSVMWLVGAIVLTSVHIYFPESKPASPPVSPRAAPSVTHTPLTPEPSADQIAKAWDEVRFSDNVGALVGFATKYPNSQLADEAWSRAETSVASGKLQIASLDNNIELIASLLEHKEKATGVLNRFADEHDLARRYPLGFAIFYADGRKILSYGAKKQSGAITFDPSAMTVTFNDKIVCLSTFPVRINGQRMTNVNNVCFGGNGSIMHAIQFGSEAAIDIEPLGESQQGLAWVIGMRRP